MEKRKVKIEEKISRELLAGRLRKMALDLENGRLEVQSGDKTISLSVPEFMPLEIEAKRKENKEKVIIEISWRELTIPVGGEETSDEHKKTTDTGSIESLCCVETGIPSENVASATSSVVPVPTEETTETVSKGSAGGVENDCLIREAAAGCSSEMTEPVAGENAEPTGVSKSRSGRRRK